MVDPIWTPTEARVKSSNLIQFINYLNRGSGITPPLPIASYAELYNWSVTKTADFWESLWRFYNLRTSAPYTRVMGPASLASHSRRRSGPSQGGPAKMPGTQWFEGARINFAEHLLRFRDNRPALISWGEGPASPSSPRVEAGQGGRDPVRITYGDLFLRVAGLARSLKDLGIRPGDRIAGYLPNIIETVVAMLATTSLGAVWSSCSPDFGVKGVLDRFSQIEPKVLFTANGYTYNGKRHDCLPRVQEIMKNLPGVKRVVVVPYTEPKPKIDTIPHAILWDDFLSPNCKEIPFARLPFDHPLYIMYSSGTTGVPKCIVHGAGGTLLQHLKELSLHTDLKREDRIFYFTTCGWMMWNWLVSSLAVGATVVLYEGSPSYPDLNTLWKMASEEKISIFGTSPKFLTACEKAGVTPGRSFDLPGLKAVLSTGSPLSVENFEWVYRNVKSDLHLASISGGTDIMGCFMLGNPTLPVYRGEIQGPGLGMKIECFNENGRPVRGGQGELVCTAPFPSMPIYFWKDPDGKKYHDAYFDVYPDIWRHGDFIEITTRGGIIVYGRSDATLNPGGVRIGTAEIYRQVESIPEVTDSLVVGQKWENDVRVVLFVVLKKGHLLDEPFIKKIKQTIRKGATPRHVPAKILQVNEIPYTVSGKKVELAVTRLIHNEPVKNKSALANPKSLEGFENRSELRDKLS